MPRIYLSMVDPDDTGKREAGNLSFSVPIEARERLREPCPLSDCSAGGTHEILWYIDRKLCGTFGTFMLFKINGYKVIVDASLPVGVTGLPRDAKRLAPEQAAYLWHQDTPMHVFGAHPDDPAPVEP